MNFNLKDCLGVEFMQLMQNGIRYFFLRD